MQVKKQQLEMDMEQQTGSKLGEEHIKAVYCHPAYLTYRQSTSRENPGWMKFKLDLEKAEEPEIKLLTSAGSEKKLENFRKISTSASLARLKPLTVWIKTAYGKLLK